MERNEAILLSLKDGLRHAGIGLIIALVVAAYFGMLWLNSFLTERYAPEGWRFAGFALICAIEFVLGMFGWRVVKVYRVLRHG